MKLALAQTRAVVGDVDANVRNHLRLIGIAVAAGAHAVVFPELSLAGYEPKLCGELALDLGDARLHVFQRASDSRAAIVAVGAPLRTSGKPQIGLVLFQPHTARRAYAKQHLHADEVPFFAPGPPTPGVLDTAPKLGLAICYELSVEAHAEATFRAGARAYVASVAKTSKGVAAAHARLAAIAARFGAQALMVNCIGDCDGATCTGGSAFWNARGDRVAVLGEAQQGVLLCDLATGQATVLPA